MAHFAEIDNQNKVLRVIVVNNEVLLDQNGVEQESLGIQFCQQLFSGNWVQTSYNASFRKNLAGIDYTYDPILDAFIPPKPYPSWLLNTETCKWQAPIPYPNDGKEYIWNEELLAWEALS